MGAESFVALSGETILRPSAMHPTMLSDGAAHYTPGVSLTPDCRTLQVEVTSISLLLCLQCGWHLELAHTAIANLWTSLDDWTQEKVADQDRSMGEADNPPSLGLSKELLSVNKI